MMKKSKPLISVEKEAAAWRRMRGLEKRLTNAMLLAMACLPEPLITVAPQAEIVVLLTTDAAVRRLNRDFRGLDKPTNVLSFPSFTSRELRRLAPKKERLHIGDIAIAYDTTKKEAAQEGKAFLDHLTHLAIHGTLHLFGYDHDTPARAARMEKLEREVMASLGLPDPY